MLDLEKLLATERNNLPALAESHINPAFVKVLRLLGFDKRYIRGQGAYLFDDQGQRYIDCLAGYGTFACGRNHPVIRQVVQQAMELELPNLLHMGIATLSGLLARELLSVAPGDLETVFFTNSGSEGVETALKYARIATGRPRIVHCDKSFHGLTLGALSVNGHDIFRDGFGPLLPNVGTVPYNDLAALEQELSRGDVAGLIIEPIQGEGVYMPDDDYLASALALCRQYGTIFIADEVQTGLGRTGKMFACEHWGIEPDILISAKALSGGYVPAGAVLSKKWIHNKVYSSLERSVVHSSTFSENDLAMAAGLATLHVLKTEGLVENAARMGDRLAAGLREIGAKYEMFREVRGKGLLLGLEFQSPQSLSLKMGWNLLHKLDPSLFCQVMLIPLLHEHQVLAQVAGHHIDVIKLIPTLVINEADVDHLIHAFDQVIASSHRFPGPLWDLGKRFAGT
ncbi:MAG: aspartate aminotransferase family protein, partial [Planctomycetes bacterium]|nr:aspartate aminotransferase family protein [Planctomycetota bacterium]